MSADDSFKPILSNSDLGTRRISSSRSNSSIRIYNGLYSEYPEINKKHDYRDCLGAVRANFRKLFHFLCAPTKIPQNASMCGKVWRYTKDCLYLYLPSLTWMPQYNLRWFRRDLVAGVTVAILLIPQSLAYAGIAGLKAHYGLYSSIVPLYVYSLTSSSTQISPGITASMCILISSATETIAPSASEKTKEYTEAVLTLTFASGIIFMLLSLLKLGGTAMLLSGPVMNGYILASALIILMSQQGALWKINISRSDEFYQQFQQLIRGLPHIHPWTAILSISCIIILLLPKWFPNRIPRWFPMPLLIMVLMTVLSTVLNLKQYGIDLVGELKSGFLPIHTPNPHYLRKSELWLHAFVIALVLYADNISLARAFGIKAQERHRIGMEEYKRFKMSQKEKEKMAEVRVATMPPHVVDQDGKKLSLNDGSLLDLETSDEIKLSVLVDGKVPIQNQNNILTNTVNNADSAVNAVEKIQPDGSGESTKNNQVQPSKLLKQPLIRFKKKPPPLPTIEVSANVELMAYGLATIIGSFFSSIMCAASFSRTSLNFEMRGFTQMAVIIQATICFICLIALGAVLSNMPKCVLACVVVSSVSSLVISGVSESIFLWRIRRRELLEYLVIVIAPLIWGLSIGIILGVLASMLLQFWNSSQAEVVELGGIQLPEEQTLPGSEIKYVDIRRFPDAQIVPDVPILEMRAELSFINYQRLLDSIEQRIHQGYRCIVVSLAHTHRLDTTALRQLLLFLQQHRHVYIAFAQCRGPVRDILTRTRNQGLLKLNNVDQFVTIHDATTFCKNRLSKRANGAPLPTINDEDESEDENENKIEKEEHPNQHEREEDKHKYENKIEHHNEQEYNNKQEPEHEKGHTKPEEEEEEIIILKNDSSNN